MIKKVLGKLADGYDLSFKESKDSMTAIMRGEATPAQISCFLTALKMKGETIDEISAFAQTMREFCNRITPNVNGRLVDTCGTGGDRVNTFNISTVSAFVVAGANVSIAKHGNRSVTSKCGSADVLENLGLNLALKPADVEALIEKIGIGFIYAPAFHPAMKHAIGPRRELGISTIFNILGPLTNPADADAQLLGVFDPRLTEPLAQTLMALGCEEAMVVHATDAHEGGL